jgi:hypothetical protein
LVKTPFQGTPVVTLVAMPCIDMYLAEEDAAELHDWLSRSGEVRFLIRDGEHRWRAVEQIGKLPNNRVLLWHVPSGPLPLLGENGVLG